MSQTVSTRQFAIIIFIVAVSPKIFMLPALIMGISGRDSWLTLLVYFFIELAVLICILAANKKNPNATIYQLLESITGKVVSKLILFAIIFFYLFKTTVLISEIKVFFTVTATESLNWQLCLIPFLVTLGLMSLKTLRSIGRLGEIILPLVFVCFIILALIMAKSINLTNLFPLFENGVKDNFNSFILLPIWLSDFSILAIFLGKIEHRKKLATASVISAVIAFITVLYFNIVMFCTYSYSPNLLDYGHNVTNMILYPTGTYNYGRFDLVIFSAWMLGIIIHIVLLFYTICRHLSKATGIKNNYITALINMAAFFILIEFVFPDELKLYSYSISLFNYFAFIIEIIFPIFILISSIFYKRKRQKNKLPLRCEAGNFE